MKTSRESKLGKDSKEIQKEISGVTPHINFNERTWVILDSTRLGDLDYCLPSPNIGTCPILVKVALFIHVRCRLTGAKWKPSGSWVNSDWDWAWTSSCIEGRTGKAVTSSFQASHPCGLQQTTRGSNLSLQAVPGEESAGPTNFKGNGRVKENRVRATAKILMASLQIQNFNPVAVDGSWLCS